MLTEITWTSNVFWWYRSCWEFISEISIKKFIILSAKKVVKFDTQCKIGDFPFTLLTTDYRKSKHYLETGYEKSKHHWSTTVHNII